MPYCLTNHFSYSITHPVSNRNIFQVKEAFSGMNEALEAGKHYEAFMKSVKSPTDIMNIMDVTMRRLVKMAKKVRYFASLQALLFSFLLTI